MRQGLDDHAGELIQKTIELALGGDPVALKLCLERILPPLRPVELPVEFSLPATGLTAQAAAVVQSVAAGELTVTQGQAVTGMVATVARVVEVDELRREVEKLKESILGNDG